MLDGDSQYQCTTSLWSRSHLMQRKRKRKDCAFRRQLNEKPSFIIPCCPGDLARVVILCDNRALQQQFAGLGRVEYNNHNNNNKSNQKITSGLVEYLKYAQ